MQPPIYLDNAASTRLDPRVLDAMLPHLGECYGNAASHTHVYGWRAEEAVARARAQVAQLLNCAGEELIWTSGATESNNLALRGLIAGLATRGRRVLSPRTEHASVLAPLRDLAARGQIELSLLDVRRDGSLDLQAFAEALRPGTVLASVMWVNNETGVVQDIAAISAICRAHGVLLHVDATQAVGKLAIDLSALDIAALSFSAHKLHGPQGIGALYLRREVRAHLQPQQLGGSQEQGLRAGTLPVHQIVGCAEACRLAQLALPQEGERLRRLRDRLWQGLSQLPGVFLNGHASVHAPQILNVGFEQLPPLALLEKLSATLAISGGAACSSAQAQASPVLLALGRSPQQALSSLRFSLGRYSSEQDVDLAIEQVAQALRQLRSATAKTPAAGEEKDCPMKRMRRRAQQRAAQIPGVGA